MSQGVSSRKWPHKYNLAKDCAVYRRRELRLLRRLLVEELEVRNVLSTFQNFDVDDTGTHFNRLQVENPPAAIEVNGGPTDVGRFLRLGHAANPPNVNTITFDRSDQGVFDQVIADFDFRITPANGRADGFVFALLNTSIFTTPNVEPEAAAEEGNYAASLGVGFDIYKNDHPDDYPTDIGDNIIRPNYSNSISIHFNSTLLTQVDVTPVVDLARGQWIHARVLMRPGGGFSDVSVILTPCDEEPVTVVDRLAVAGLSPYEGRVHFASRSGGETATFDLDNIDVQFMGLSETTLSLSAVSYSASETDTTVQVTVNRSGGDGGPVSTQYFTSNGTAVAGGDYTAIPPAMLSFAAGEMSKSFNVSIVNDAELEGAHSFLVSLTNPIGARIAGHASAGIRIHDDEASRLLGDWSRPQCWPVVPIHMNLLPTGEVMFWDRFGDTRIWNPSPDTFDNPDDPDFNIFCSGHTFLPNGHLLVAGGHHHGGDPLDDFKGINAASTFDPVSGDWTPLPPMNDGRWYPTNTVLPNGDVLVVSGTVDEGDVNELPQIWQPASGTWRNLTGANAAAPLGVDLYPRMFVLPDGRLFKVGADQDTWFLNTSGTGAWTPGPLTNVGLRGYGSAVMYAPGKILIVGGGRVDDPDLNAADDATATAEVIDLNLPNPAWRPVGSMEFARRQLNATILPDGKVLVTGGLGGPGFNNETNPVLPAEVWNPVTENWTTLATSEVTRGYHSAAMLLPNGQVISAGGGQGAAASSFHNDAEFFSPPYLFGANRPVISGAPSSIGYGQSFVMQTPSAARITKISLIPIGSVTHSFNQNQRYISFDASRFTVVQEGLNIRADLTDTVATPGHYMLFALDNDGIPSEAKIIQVTHDPDDIVGRHPDGGWYVAESTGTGFTNKKWATWANVAWEDVHVGDVNGDGLDDVVGRHPTNHGWYVARSNGANFVNEKWATWAGVDWLDVQIADVNGDGLDDIVGRHPTDHGWYVARSTGTLFVSERWATWADAAWRDVRVGDVNADGRDDIVARHPTNGGWYVARSNGTSFLSEKWATWANVDWLDVRVSDFNGDGRADIVARHPTDHGWYVARSAGSFFITEKWATWANVQWLDVLVGDFNGDGRDDLIGRHPTNGGWYVARSTGTNFLNEKWTTWAIANWLDAHVADVNGDGRSDIVARHPVDHGWYVARSTGAFFMSEKWTTWAAVQWLDVNVGNFDGRGGQAARSFFARGAKAADDSDASRATSQRGSFAAILVRSDFDFVENTASDAKSFVVAGSRLVDDVVNDAVDISTKVESQVRDIVFEDLYESVQTGMIWARQAGREAQSNPKFEDLLDVIALEKILMP